MTLITSRFLALNKARLDRTLELMPSRQRPLIPLIPLLFHVNNSEMPGGENESTPKGIFNFQPDDEPIKTARKIWRNFQYKSSPRYSFDIEAIFFMGSCGSIAFNANSDFDVWICYRNSLSADDLQKLQEKATVIENWFDAQNIEVHFFLMNAEAFKKGRVSKLSAESSGTAQYHLLLDEFFRSSIWIAGKKPLWWEISTAEEKAYEKSKKELEAKSLIDLTEYIDFGGLPVIPKSEFFGAAVWQIYKGIDSPYKSILKITLMEAYVESYPEITPLSVYFKKQVYEGETDPLELDAYLLMLNRIDNYLKRKSDLSRLEIVRRSFYLKLALPLSNQQEQSNWRNKIIRQLVLEDWGWSPEKIERLDNNHLWSLEDVTSERKLLVNHLSNSYSFLSHFARKHATKKLIKPKDLTILGRKLYSAFDRKAGKIEIFNRGITSSMTEESITIRLFYGKDKREYWRIYRGKVISNQYKNKKPLKQTLGLIELLAWSYANKLVSESTQRLMYAPASGLGNTELNTLLSVTTALLGKDKNFTPRSKDLLKPATITKGAIFINLGKQPTAMGSSVEQKIISGEIDVLNFGGKKHCLIESIEHLYLTSWKELFAFKYYDADGLANWLCASLNMYKESLDNAVGELKISADVYSFGSGISHILSSRINKLYKSIIQILLSDKKLQSAYVYKAGKHYYLINYENDHFDFKKFSGLPQLIDSLSLPRNDFLQLSFDEYADLELPLQSIYQLNKPDVIQMFGYEERKDVHLFILDEFGVLFYQALPLDDSKNVLVHFRQFMMATLERRAIDENTFEFREELLTPPEESVEMYKVTSTGTKYAIELLDFTYTPTVQNMEIQVIGEQVNNKPVFTFYCNDLEFSSTEHGSDVFNKVASHIRELRSDHKDYYFYITDLELSPSLLGKKNAHKVQTCELLKYKKRIESNLNKHMRNT